MTYAVLIVYSKGQLVLIPTKIEFLSFSLSNSVGPDEMPRHLTFHLGFHGLPKYSLGFPVYTGLNGVLNDNHIT